MSSKNPRFSLNGDGKHPEPLSPDHRKEKVVAALGKRYKALNQLWENAEADLKEIPVPVDVPYRYKSVSVDEPHEPRGFEMHFYIGFVKSKGGWRICHGTQHDGYPEYDYDWKPITECSVDIRLEAAPHINKLRERVLEKAEECVTTLDRTISDFRNTLQSW